MKLWRAKDTYIEEKGSECFVVVCGKIIRSFFGDNNIIEADRFINEMKLTTINGENNVN